jgi:thiamine pyrophosphate-dependent acetolactate synthase large subunit-like protein
MLMSGLELVTAVRENLALTAVVFNDGVYGLIRNAQLAGHGESHGTELHSPDFEALAAATGAEYRQVGADGITAALSRDSRALTVLLEVPLKDSRGLQRIGRRGKLRAFVKRSFAADFVARFRRWLRR